MRSIDVGIGHDDDALVAKILLAVFRPRAATERLYQVGDLLVGGKLFAAGTADVEDLAAERQDRLVGTVAPLFGRSACRVALDDEEFGAFRGVLRTIG